MIFAFIFIAIIAVPAILGIIGGAIIPSMVGVLLAWGVGLLISLALMGPTEGFSIYPAGILVLCFILTIVFWNNPEFQEIMATLY